MRKTQPWLWSKWAVQVKASFGVDEEFLVPTYLSAVAFRQGSLSDNSLTAPVQCYWTRQLLYLIHLCSYCHLARVVTEVIVTETQLPSHQEMSCTQKGAEYSQAYIALSCQQHSLSHSILQRSVSQQTWLLQCIGLGLIWVEQRRQDLITMQVRLTLPERWQGPVHGKKSSHTCKENSSFCLWHSGSKWEKYQRCLQLPH